jgi:hypothetical protein
MSARCTMRSPGWVPATWSGRIACVDLLLSGLFGRLLGLYPPDLSHGPLQIARHIRVEPRPPQLISVGCAPRGFHRIIATRLRLVGDSSEVTNCGREQKQGRTGQGSKDTYARRATENHD